MYGEKGEYTMQGISNTDWNMLMRKINAVNSKYREAGYIQVRDDVFVELDFNKSKNYFGIDILEGVYHDHGQSTGSGVLGYSHGYTPNILPTAIKLVKNYIGDKDFYEVLKNEYKTNKNFSNYFSEKTGIDYHDLVDY